MQTLDSRIPAVIRERIYILTAAQFEDQLKNDPDDVRTQSFAATFFARFQQYDKALLHYNKAIALSPTRQSTYLDLAMMYLSMGRYADAEATAKQAYDILPANTNAGLAYATTLIYQKKVDEASIITANLGDTAFDNRIVNAYGNGGYFTKVVELENEKIAKGLADGHDYFALAGGLASLGQKEQAIAAINKAVSLDGSLKDQGDQLIKQLNAGRPLTK